MSSKSFLFVVLSLTIPLSHFVWIFWVDLNKQRQARWGYKLWYRTIYLNSLSWKFSRRVKFFWSGRKCRKCGARSGLDVHHKTYRFKWWEWLFPWTLEVLCRSCHNTKH